MKRSLKLRMLTVGAAIVLLTFAVLLIPEVRQMRRQLPQIGVTGGLESSALKPSALVQPTAYRAPD